MRVKVLQPVHSIDRLVPHHMAASTSESGPKHRTLAWQQLPDNRPLLLRPTEPGASGARGVAQARRCSPRTATRRTPQNLNRVIYTQRRARARAGAPLQFAYDDAPDLPGFVRYPGIDYVTYEFTSGCPRYITYSKYSLTVVAGSAFCWVAGSLAVRAALQPGGHARCLAGASP